MLQSLAHLFLERVEKSGPAVAVRYKENKAPYRDLSWTDFSALIKDMAFGLAALGLQSEDRAAIMSSTAYQWVAADLSIMSAGGISVAIYPTSSIVDIEFILNDSEAKIVFVYNENLLNRVLKVKERVPGIQKIVLLTAPAAGKSLSELSLSPGLVIGLEELLELGRALKAEKPGLVDERTATLTRERLATIIYTSGTTGTPKGVMLTHHNILSVVESLPAILPFFGDDVFLSFLPLSHVFERVCGEYYWIYCGCVCAYAEGMETVAKNMREIEPSVMIVVPRLLDKIYLKVKAGIEESSSRTRALIRWAVNVGREVLQQKNAGKEMGLLLRAKFHLAQKLVLARLRKRIGERLRLIASGGAPANPEVIEFFCAIGIPVVEGYGLTETSAPTHANRLEKNKFGTVGSIIDCVEMKLAPDGEICFKGASIFAGYYRAPALSAEVFKDGWFHTGDIGEIDSDGYLKITDRKKDIIINSAGKNIAPQKVENTLKTIPIVTQSIVFGDKVKSLVALITLDEQMTLELAQAKKWPHTDFASLLAGPELRKYLKDEIHEVCRHLAEYERVSNFAVLPHELSVEEGELTATLKVRRSVLKEEYRELVESLYKEETLVVAR